MAAPENIFVTKNGVNSLGVILSSGIDLYDIFSTGGSGDVTKGYLSDNYLPLSGGSLTGNLTANNIDSLGAILSSGIDLYNIFGAGDVTKGYLSDNYLPLSGGNLTGGITVNGIVSSSSTAYASALRIGHIDQAELQQFPNAIATFHSDVNSYQQVNAQNINAGTNASSDFVATADLGNDASYFVDLGINNSGYNNPEFTITKAFDSYLYSADGNLVVGAGSGDRDLVLFAGGTLDSNEVMRIKSGRQVTTTGLLCANGVVYASGGDSDQWNSNFTFNNTNSAFIINSLTDLATASGAFVISGGPITQGLIRLLQQDQNLIEIDTGLKNTDSPVFSALTITGNLSVLGDLIYVDTLVTVTSALSVVNQGTGPALTVIQYGANQPIATFVDKDGGAVTIQDGGLITTDTSDSNKWSNAYSYSNSTSALILGDISNLATTSGYWNDAFNRSTVYAINSASYITSAQAESNYLALTGGTVTGNVTVVGYVSALSCFSTTFANPSGNVTIKPSLSEGYGVYLYNSLNWARHINDSPTEIGDLITFTPTMGVIDGGALSAGSGLVLEVGEMVAYTMRNVPFQTHQLVKIETLGLPAASRQITLPANSDVYIYYNSLGVLNYNVNELSTRTNILLGRAVTDSTKIIYLDKTPINAHHWSNYTDRMLREALGPVFSTGGIATSAVAPYTLNISAATYYFSQTRITTTAQTPVTFDSLYRSTTPGVYNRITGVTAVDNVNYDDGSGTLATIPLTSFAKHTMYLDGTTSQFLLVYGQELFETSGLAEAAPVAIPPSYIKDSFVILCSTVVSPVSAHVVTIIDERPRLGFVSSSQSGVIQSHGDLQNLLEDDHPQYLPVNGDRGMTGNLNLSANLQVAGNTTFYGNISALSGLTIVGETLFTSGSALSVINLGGGPALYVQQVGNVGDIASFYDTYGNEVLHLKANSPVGGRVGINTGVPNVEFTVAGAISASRNIYASGGNSDLWNSSYTATNGNSAKWDQSYSNFTFLTAASSYTSTDVTTNSANWNKVSQGYFLPVSGGNLTGPLSSNNNAGFVSLTATGKYNINNTGQIFDYQNAGTGIYITNVGDMHFNTQNTQWIRMGGWGILSFISPINIGGPNHDPYLAIYSTDYGIAEQRNAKIPTRPQTYRIYNTYTDNLNFERFTLSAGPTENTISSEALGTGWVRPIAFKLNGNTFLTISSGGVTSNNGILSSNSVVYASGGNSNLWNQSYSNFTWLTANSGFALPTNVTANSAYWNSAYSALTSTSGYWNTAYSNFTWLTGNSAFSLPTNVTLHTAYWDSGYSALTATSGYWNTAYSNFTWLTANSSFILPTNITTNSAYWNSAYSALTSTSAFWNQSYSNFTWLTANSAFSLPTNITTHTAYWDSSYSALTSTSAFWNTAYSNFTWLTGNSSFALPTNITTHTAYWDSGYSALTSTSAFWNTAYSNFTWLTGNSSFALPTNVTLHTAYWDSGYSALTATSAFWNQSYSNFTWLTANSSFVLPTNITTHTAYWDSGYSALTSNSAFWSQSYSNFTWLTANSAFSLPTNVTTHTAYWDSSYSVLTATSAFWNQSYSNFTWLTGNSAFSLPTNVTTNSAYWNNAYSALTATSAFWNQSYSNFTFLTAASSYTSTDVTTNSANWNKVSQGYFLPLSGGNMTGPLSSNNTAIFISVTGNELITNGVAPFSLGGNITSPLANGSWLLRLLGAKTGIVYDSGGTTGLSFWTGNVLSYAANNAGLTLPYANILGWSSSPTAFYPTLALSGQSTTNIVEINAGTAGAVRDLKVRDLYANTIYLSSGNSNLWNSSYSALTSTSAFWNQSYSNFTWLTGNSASQFSLPTNVTTHTAYWDSSYSVLTANSAFWNQSYSNFTWLTGNSASQFSLPTDVTTHTAYWDSSYSVLTANSGFWNTAYSNFTWLTGNSANVVAVLPTNVTTHTAYWDSSYSVLTANSAFWNQSYSNFTWLTGNSANIVAVLPTNVTTHTAYWDSAYSALTATSAFWNTAYSNFTWLTGNSANIIAILPTNVTTHTAYWDSAYSALTATSAFWNQSYSNFTFLTAASSYTSTDVTTKSAYWNAGYSALTANSAFWNTAYSNFTFLTAASSYTSTDVTTKSAYWNTGYSALTSNSAFWNQAYSNFTYLTAASSYTSTAVTLNSAYWNSAYSALTSTSAFWNQAYSNFTFLTATSSYTSTDVTTKSAYWNASYSALTATSGFWNVGYSVLTANSAFWNQSYSNFTFLTAASSYTSTAVTLNSAYWNAGYSALTATSGFWNTAYSNFTFLTAASSYTSTDVTTNTAYWDSAYSALTATSAFWNQSYSNFTWLTANSANIVAVLPTSITTSSAYWNASYSALTATSGFWNQSYSNFTWLTGNSANVVAVLPTDVTTNTAYWESGYSALTATSGFWNQSYSNFTWLTGNSANTVAVLPTSVTTNSAYWNASYSALTATSASWDDAFNRSTVYTVNSASYSPLGVVIGYTSYFARLL